ncbi:MAG TPA: hypothetical protein VJ892_03805, partial [Candidatus Absconditabacterales bacterium]|nr:hypothetical protein [Candidatus Absconditabacterales bacterium]
ESSEAKRERREKIRDLAGDDPEKIGKLKEVLYDNDEEQKESDKHSEVGQGKEQKESIEDLPKLEKENFRINSKKWKEIIFDPNGVKVKVNPEGDAWEYLEGDYKGEQFFTKASAIRETKKAGKTLPKSSNVFEDIINKKYEGNYKNFLKGENIKFCGWCGPSDETFGTFYDIDEVFNIWCEDGSNFYGDRNGWVHGNKDDYSFSVRCIQD